MGWRSGFERPIGIDGEGTVASGTSALTYIIPVSLPFVRDSRLKQQ